MLGHNSVMTMIPNPAAPIGVFDSGVGGLTVLKALREALPAEDLMYLGDTARLPYGTKSPASVARYATQATALLQARGVKLLVVACNTASAVALDSLRESLAPLPVIGVVEPGAGAATATGGHDYLVLATEATVRLGAYRHAIQALDPKAQVNEIACELLVALAEEGWQNGPIATAIVERYIAELPSKTPDAVILGCTHFPILAEPIAAAFPDGTAIVDSASTTAQVVAAALAEGALMNPNNAPGRLELLATDGATRFARVGGQFLGESLTPDDVSIVDI